MKIEVQIERVIFDGVAVERPGMVRRALEQELRKRLVEGGLAREWKRGGAVPGVRGGGIRIGKHAGGEARLGAQVASAVYEGLGRKR
jgi:hypothetical protein